MSCVRPIKGYRTTTGVSFSQLRRDDHVGDIEIPCGQCIGCRMRRASDWSLRVMHEASLYDQNCFVTLTYGRDCLPPGASLWHEDFQRFMKRLRKHVGRPVRFYMCGEYGPVGGRPHYHACLFNVDFRADRIPAGKSGSDNVFFESAELTKLWSHGKATVQDLVPETASYCARYIMKKILGPDSKTAYNVVIDGKVVERKPEYAAMSLKPGIGARWFERYKDTDVYAHDFVVQDGVKRRPPKYYDKLFKKRGGMEVDAVEYARQLRAKDAAPDNTDERRRVREEVQLAKVSTLKRGLE